MATKSFIVYQDYMNIPFPSTPAKWLRIAEKFPKIAWKLCEASATSGSGATWSATMHRQVKDESSERIERPNRTDGRPRWAAVKHNANKSVKTENDVMLSPLACLCHWLPVCLCLGMLIASLTILGSQLTAGIVHSVVWVFIAAQEIRWRQLMKEFMNEKCCRFKAAPVVAPVRLSAFINHC